MPVRRVNAMPTATDNAQPSSATPGLLQKSLYYLGQGLESPGELINSLAKFAGEPALLKGQPISNTLAQLAGYTPAQLQPSNFSENVAQRALGNIPSTVALGGSPLATSIGAGVAELGGLFGASEPVKTGLQIAGEVGSGRFLNAIPTTASNRPEPRFPGISNYSGMSDLANKERALATGAITPKDMGYYSQLGERTGSKVSSGLNKAINNINEAVSVGTNKERQVLNQADRILQNSLKPDNTLEFASGLKARQQLDKLIPHVSGQAKTALMDIRSELNNHLKYKNITSPTYAKHLTKADKINEVNSLINETSGAIQDWAKGLKGGQYSKWIGTPLSKGVGKAGDILSRFSVLAKNDPVLGAEHYGRLLTATLANNSPTIIRELTTMGKMVEKKVPKATEIKKGKVYRVLSPAI